MGRIRFNSATARSPSLRETTPHPIATRNAAIVSPALPAAVKYRARRLRPPADARRGPKTTASHQLSQAEKDEVVQLVNQPAYRNLSPEQAVAKLAGEGIYVCSERSLRRVLRERQLDRYRQRSKPAKGHNKPRQHVACEPLRVLSWDIMRSSTVRGGYFYLYLFLDVWSRRIVGAEVHESQQAELAAGLLSKLCIEHNLETESWSSIPITALR